MIDAEREFYCHRLLTLVVAKVNGVILDWDLTWKRDSGKLYLYPKVLIVDYTINGEGYLQEEECSGVWCAPNDEDSISLDNDN